VSGADSHDLICINPSTGQIEWQGKAADAAEVDRAITAARAALPQWADTLAEHRIEKIMAVADGYRARQAELADAICRHTGKPRWEALAEVDAMIAKAAISVTAFQQRRSDSSRNLGDFTASLRFKPIGVLGVLGPFNMPGHLPNGHVMPAVLAGNTVVFKPSEMTCRVGELMAEIWTSAGVPANVLNLVQGGVATGTAMVNHPSIDGILFTGSAAAGTAIQRALGDRPDKMVALEMGGNNPLVFWDCADLDAAAHCICQSAFITSGQRCSCARRLIVPNSAAGEAIISRLIQWMGRIGVGLYTDDTQPFMGTVISARAAAAMLEAQHSLVQRGATILVPMRSDPRSAALLWPGLIDVTDVLREDAELFGPLLQVIRVTDFNAAIAEANATEYGLSAGLISDRADLYDQFRRRVRAGVLNWNRPLTGARSDLPFGGIGRSGNHRASAFFAADYCSDPVASLEANRLPPVDRLGPGIRGV
jgi:succinylglutamic semialdehyde dehydrogenase